jgi:hypothetical protein
MDRLISPATGGMLWSHLAKCSLLLSIQAHCCPAKIFHQPGTPAESIS